MLRMKLKYGGEVNGSEPESTVAKIMLGFVNKTPIQWRLLFSLMGGVLDVTNENFLRNDIRFCRTIIPIIGEKYSHPKVYYTGITDKGDRNFFTGVVLNKRCKVKTVTRMADMKEWDSYNWFDVNCIMVGGVA